MRMISVVNYMTLDGVMQSPADKNEDPSGGFTDGGWVVPYLDDVWGRVASEGMGQTDALLFGRKTYQKMEAFWPNQPEDDPIASMMNRSTKYVVSKTLDEVTWENSVLIKGDAATEIRKIKEGPGKGITVLGSGELLKTLIAGNLIDEYKLVLYPLVLGNGKRLFKDGAKAKLELVDSLPTSTGGIILTYRPAKSEG